MTWQQAVRQCPGRQRHSGREACGPIFLVFALCSVIFGEQYCAQFWPELLDWSAFVPSFGAAQTFKGLCLFQRLQQKSNNSIIYGLGHWRIVQVQIDISLYLGGFKRLPGWFGALIYCHSGDFMSFLKLVPECPVECRRGGVTPIAIWAMPKCRVWQILWVFPSKHNADVPMKHIYYRNGFFMEGLQSLSLPKSWYCLESLSSNSDWLVHFQKTWINGWKLTKGNTFGRGIIFGNTVKVTFA